MFIKYGAHVSIGWWKKTMSVPMLLKMISMVHLPPETARRFIQYRAWHGLSLRTVRADLAAINYTYRALGNMELEKLCFKQSMRAIFSECYKCPQGTSVFSHVDVIDFIRYLQDRCLCWDDRVILDCYIFSYVFLLRKGEISQISREFSQIIVQDDGVASVVIALFDAKTMTADSVYQGLACSELTNLLDPVAVYRRNVQLNFHPKKLFGFENGKHVTGSFLAKRFKLDIKAFRAYRENLGFPIDGIKYTYHFWRSSGAVNLHDFGICVVDIQCKGRWSVKAKTLQKSYLEKNSLGRQISTSVVFSATGRVPGRPQNTVNKRPLPGGAFDLPTNKKQKTFHSALRDFHSAAKNKSSDSGKMLTDALGAFGHSVPEFQNAWPMPPPPSSPTVSPEKIPVRVTRAGGAGGAQNEKKPKTLKRTLSYSRKKSTAVPSSQAKRPKRHLARQDYKDLTPFEIEHGSATPENLSFKPCLDQQPLNL